MKKENINIPKDFYDKKIAEQQKRIISMTNEEKLQELEDILYRKLEGEARFEIIRRKLELLLLIAQIKKLH